MVEQFGRVGVEATNERGDMGSPLPAPIPEQTGEQVLRCALGEGGQFFDEGVDFVGLFVGFAFGVSPPRHLVGPQFDEPVA